MRTTDLKKKKKEINKVCNNYTDIYRVNQLYNKQKRLWVRLKGK